MLAIKLRDVTHGRVTVTMGLWGYVMKNKFTKFLKDDSGATAIEYGLLAALIGIAIIGGARLFSTRLNQQWNFVSDTFENSVP